jgi:hypothetical protein
MDNAKTLSIGWKEQVSNSSGFTALILDEERGIVLTLSVAGRQVNDNNL